MHNSDPNDQIKSGMEGNQACLQCHDDFKLDITGHTHHAADSSGSLCYNCHMHHTTYGLLKAIRSHEIESPSVSTTVQTGRIHACNACHLDKSLGWTAEYTQQWYGEATPMLSPEQRDISAALLHLLQGDAGQRAIAAWHMGWEPARIASREGWLAPFLAEILSDPYSVVRYIAFRSLRQQPGFEKFRYDYTLSMDSLRSSVDKAKDHWQANNQDANIASPEILIDDGGRVMQQRVEDIMSRRDDKPIDLLE